MLDALALGQGLTVDTETRGQLIDNLQGLTLGEAENALAWALVSDKSLKPATVGAVKGQMVSQTAGLSFSNYQGDFNNVIGNDNLKTFLINRIKNHREGLPIKGVMLLGTPGNGKSEISKALGNQIGWPCVNFDFARIFGGLVGQSEEQLDRALGVLRAIAPCVCFVDEIDKALAGAGGGTGTNETTVRAAGKFLQFLQDHDEMIFFMATCNNMDSLAEFSDGAFIRAGRWDAIFFMDNPDTEQGLKILDFYLVKFTGKGLADYPENPNIKDYSGAEIRQIAIETAYNGGNLLAAARFVKPLARINKENLEVMRKKWVPRTEPAHIPAAADTTRAINLT